MPLPPTAKLTPVHQRCIARQILADDCAALREELRELTQDGTFTSAQVAQQYAEDVGESSTPNTPPQSISYSS